MNNQYYKDKICVVTGAASGIGLATVKLLLEEEAIVYALDTSPTRAFGAISVFCDLTSKESIDEAFANIPEKIDCFFGAASVTGLKNNFYQTFIINFISYKYLTDVYLSERMKKKGTICYVSSNAGNHWDTYSDDYKCFMRLSSWDSMIDRLESNFDSETDSLLAYSASKRALNCYMSQEALDFSEKGVRVNAVAPSANDTDVSSKFAFETKKSSIICQTGAANRASTPLEIAKPMLFLNSEDASYISGICLPIDYCNQAMIMLGKKKEPFL